MRMPSDPSRIAPGARASRSCSASIARHEQQARELPIVERGADDLSDLSTRTSIRTHGVEQRVRRLGRFHLVLRALEAHEQRIEARVEVVHRPSRSLEAAVLEVDRRAEHERLGVRASAQLGREERVHVAERAGALVEQVERPGLLEERIEAGLAAERNLLPAGERVAEELHAA